MNLYSLHCNSHLRQFKEKNPWNLINQSIKLHYICKSISISLILFLLCFGKDNDREGYDN